MDPNEALERLRAIRQEYDQIYRTKTVDEALRNFQDMRDTFLFIDEWLSAGGFLPTSWRCERCQDGS